MELSRLRFCFDITTSSLKSKLPSWLNGWNRLDVYCSVLQNTAIEIRDKSIKKAPGHDVWGLGVWAWAHDSYLAEAAFWLARTVFASIP